MRSIFFVVALITAACGADVENMSVERFNNLDRAEQLDLMGLSTTKSPSIVAQRRTSYDYAVDPSADGTLTITVGTSSLVLTHQGADSTLPAQRTEFIIESVRKIEDLADRDIALLSVDLFRTYHPSAFPLDEEALKRGDFKTYLKSAGVIGFLRAISTADPTKSHVLFIQKYPKEKNKTFLSATAWGSGAGLGYGWVLVRAEK